MTYRDQVIAALKDRGFAEPLTPDEEDLIIVGQSYEVGPTDCALQIIANKAETFNGEEIA